MCLACLIGSKICYARNINCESKGDLDGNYFYRLNDVASDEKCFEEGEGEDSLNRHVREITDYSDESIDKDLHNSNEAELNLLSWWKGQGVDSRKKNETTNATLTTKVNHKSTPGLPGEGLPQANHLSLEASTLNSIHIIQVVDGTPQNLPVPEQIPLNPPALPIQPAIPCPTPQSDPHLESPSSPDTNYRTICFTINDHTRGISCPPGCNKGIPEPGLPVAPKSGVLTTPASDKTEKPFTLAEYTRSPRVDATHSATFTLSSTTVSNFWFKGEPPDIHASTNSGRIMPIYQVPVSNIPGEDMFATDNLSVDENPVFTSSSIDNNSWPIIVPNSLESSNKQPNNFLNKEFMTNTESALKFISNSTFNENKTLDTEEPLLDNSKTQFFSDFHRLLDRNSYSTKISLPQTDDNLESTDSNISNFYLLGNDTTRFVDMSLEMMNNVTNNERRLTEKVEKNMVKSNLNPHVVQKCVGAAGNATYNDNLCYGQTFVTFKNSEKVENSPQYNISQERNPQPEKNTNNLISSESVNVGNVFQKKEYLPENKFERKSIDVPLSTTICTLMSSHSTFQTQKTTPRPPEAYLASTINSFVQETESPNENNLTQHAIDPPTIEGGLAQVNPKQSNVPPINRTILIIGNTVTNPNSPSKLEILPGKIYVIQANTPEKECESKQPPHFRALAQMDQSTIKNDFSSGALDSIGKDIKATTGAAEGNLAHQKSEVARPKEITIAVTSFLTSTSGTSTDAGVLIDFPQETGKYKTSIETASGEQKKDIVDFPLQAEIPQSINLKNSLYSCVSNVGPFKLKAKIGCLSSTLSAEHSTNAESESQDSNELHTEGSLSNSSCIQLSESQLSSVDRAMSMKLNPPDLTKLNLEQVVAGVLTTSTTLAPKSRPSVATTTTHMPIPVLTCPPALHPESESKSPLLGNNNVTGVKTKDTINEPVLKRQRFEPIDYVKKNDELSNKYVNSVQSIKPGSFSQIINYMNATIKEENKLIKKVMDDTEKIDREITLKSNDEVNKTYDKLINVKEDKNNTNLQHEQLNNNIMKIGRNRRETATPANSSEESQIENETRVYYFKYNDTYLAQHSKGGLDLVEFCRNVTCKGDNIRPPCCGSRVLCKGEDLSYLLPIPGYSTSSSTSPSPSIQQKANTFLIRVPRRDDTMNNLVKFQLMHGISAPDSKELMNALKEVSYQVQKVNREFHPELNLPPLAPPPRNPQVIVPDRQMLANSYLTAAIHPQVAASPGGVPQIMDTNKILENLKSTLADSIFHTQLGQIDINDKDKYRAARNYYLPPEVLQDSGVLGTLRRKAEEEAQHIIDTETQKKRDEEIYGKSMDNNYQLIQDTNLNSEAEKKNNPLFDTYLSRMENLKKNSYLTLLQQQLGNINNGLLPNNDLYYPEVRNSPEEYPEKIIPQIDEENTCSKFNLQDNSSSEVGKRVERGIDVAKAHNSKNITNFKETFDSFHNDLLDLQKFIAANMAGGQRNNIAFSKNNSSSALHMSSER